MMDSEIVVLLLLTLCPAQPVRAKVHAFKPGVPTHTWPQSQELPEDTDPAHGRGSSESQMFIGATTANINTATGQMMTVSSEPVSNPAATWLPTGPVGVSVELVESFPHGLPSPTIDSTPSRAALSNPSIIKVRRSFTRRRG